MELLADTENVEGQFEVTGVIQGQMVYHCCMKLGRWSYFLMPTFLKVKITTGRPRSNDLPLLYGHESLWIKTSLNAEIVEVSSRSPEVIQG